MLEGAGGLLTVVFRFVVLAATTGAVGAWCFGRLVVPSVAGEAAARHRRDLAQLAGRVGMTCAAVIVLAFVPRLMLQARGLNDPGDPLWPTMMAVLSGRWGWALLGQAAVALVAAISLLRADRADRADRAGHGVSISDAAVAALAMLPAFMGHAVADPERRTLSMLVDIVHVTAAGSWVGSLAMLTIAARRLRHTPDAPGLIAALVIAFHPIAMVAAGAVFVTGLGTAWLRMGAPVGIADPTYSGLFVAKLLLVGVTGALGAGHAKLAKRRVQRVDAAAVGRSLLVESLLAVLVLAVTAVLAGTAPIG